jgi:hypothetical protein
MTLDDEAGERWATAEDFRVSRIDRTYTEEYQFHSEPSKVSYPIIYLPIHSVTYIRGRSKNVDFRKGDSIIEPYERLRIEFNLQAPSASITIRDGVASFSFGPKLRERFFTSRQACEEFYKEKIIKTLSSIDPKIRERIQRTLSEDAKRLWNMVDFLDGIGCGKDSSPQMIGVGEL